MDQRFGRAVVLSRPQGTVPRWTLALAMAAGLLLAMPASGHAASDALDQSFPATTIPSLATSTKLMAQTFTAGTNGQIDKVSLALETHSQFATGWLEIRTVGASGPNGGTQWPTTLTPIAVTSPFGNAYHDFTINPTFHVDAGAQYAIVWTSKVGIAYWWGSTQNAYAGGEAWLSCVGCAWGKSTLAKDFAFKTWVTTATTQPPFVAANQPAVSLREGSPAANAGTFSDANSRAVKITASYGTITQTGLINGTWSWSAPAADEGANQTVVITADDGNGLKSTTSFTVTFAGVPPIASFSIPASASPEGSAVNLTGTATSLSAADNAAGFTYSWNVTKNGNALASGSGSRFRFMLDDEGTFVITMNATDDGGLTGTASATITPSNTRPAATITGVTTSAPLVITPQEVLGFGGSFTDAGTMDKHTVEWNFGDGVTSSASYGPSGSASFSTSHSYTAGGTYKVSLTVTDDHGWAVVATTNVVVETPQQALTTIQNYVQSLSGLNKGQRNSLIAKLNAASASATRGDYTASHNQMSAFLNEVRADVNSGKISNGQQQILTGAIHAVEAALGTYNRMLEWWPLAP